MALEMELKYLNADFTEMRGQLERLGAKSTTAYFEENLVFDDTDRSLREKEVLLRLRFRKNKAVLTVKMPPASSDCSKLKIFEELETVVADFTTMRAMLEAVGFHVAFAYEKVREKWLTDGCVVCLDTLPFGDFVEIEGNEASVLGCAEQLGFEACQASRQTYHALNCAYREKAGLPPDENFVFGKTDRERILNQIGKE